MKNLSIGRKIALCFSVIALINLGFALFLLKELSSIQAELLNYTDDTLPAVESVDGIRDKMSYWRRTQFAVFAMSDHNKIVSKIKVNEKIREEIGTALNAYGKTVWPGEETEIYNRLMNKWQKYLATMDAFNQAMTDDNKTKAYPILTQSLANFESIESDMNALVGILKGAMESNKNQILKSIHDLDYTTIISNVVMLIIMIAIVVSLTRMICRPLARVVQQANAIADGDLSKELVRKDIGNDELGDLADSTIQMQSNLKQLIDQSKEVVKQLGEAVEQMTHIAETSSADMQKQQSQISEVATAMTLMKSSVADVAKNTDDSAEQANQANQRTQEGARDNQAMVTSIQNVAQVIGDAGDTVSELEQQSSQINVVVDVIRDIAEQTNLLALNAAIEAARAGESGRGFAVVADEVRTLAGRTQDSTSEITTIIEKLQSFSAKAKEATENSRTSIDKCAEQGHHSQELMVSIEQAIANIADMGIQIASACGEQDSVADELSRNIEEIQVASQDVAKGSEQTVKSCRELANLSSSLHESMSRFKLH